MGSSNLFNKFRIVQAFKWGSTYELVDISEKKQ